jgi:hypothetical protein
MAPSEFVEEFADVIAMVENPHMTPDQLGNPQRGPKLRAVAMRHRPFEKQTNQSFLLSRRQAARSPRRRPGPERIGTAFSQSIPPSHHAAGMTPDPPRNVMQGKLLLEKGDYSATSFFQRLRRTVRSHGDTSFRDVSSILHYLCGCQ